MALFGDNLTGFLQSQFGRRPGDEENPLLANNPIFRNWMDDLQFKRMSNVFANTLGGADTSRPAAPINPTDYGNITTAPMRPAAVIPVATPVATPAVAAMPAPALSESGLGTVARSIPPVWAQEMMKAKQAADQPLNEGQKDALRYAALAKENAILDRQKRQDEANFDMYNPIAKVTQLHMMPHIPGTFGTGVMSSTPIFDNSKQRALEAERLQEAQTARDWGLQQLAMAQHRQNALEMAGVQHGYDMDKLRASLEGHLQQAQINNPAKATQAAHLGQSALADLKNPNLPADQRQLAANEAQKLGILDKEQASQANFNTEYNRLMASKDGAPVRFEDAVNRAVSSGRQTTPMEIAALYKIANEQGVTSDRAQKLINNTMAAYGYGREESINTPYGPAKQSYAPSTNLGQKLLFNIAALARLPQAGYNTLMGGIQPGSPDANRINVAQALLRMQSDREARRKMEQELGITLP